MIYKQLFKNFGSTIGQWSIRTLPSADDVTAFLQIEHCRNIEAGKVVRTSVKVVGKNAGRANETTPDEQAAKELESRVKKQLDKGYVETIEEAKLPATNALGLQRPMLAARWKDRVAHLTVEQLRTAIIQPKLDGNRTLIQHGKAWTRQGKEQKHIAHILDEIDQAGLSDLGLDGELYIHGKPLQQINSLIKRKQAETLDLEFHVYDLFGLGDADYQERAEILAKRAVALNHVRFLFGHRIDSEAEGTSKEEYERIVMSYHDNFVANGYEGAILRIMGSAYTSNRSNSLIKIKNYQDAEFEIVGYEHRQPIYFDLDNDAVWIDGKTGREAYEEQEGDQGNLDEFIRPELRIEGDKLVLDQGVWVCTTEDGKKFTPRIQGDMWEHSRLLRAAEEGYHLGELLTVRYFCMSDDNIPMQPIALQFREND